MRMDLGTRNTLLYDFMHCMTAVSLEMSDEPYLLCFLWFSLSFLFSSSEIEDPFLILLRRGG